MEKVDRTRRPPRPSASRLRELALAALVAASSSCSRVPLEPRATEALEPAAGGRASPPTEPSRPPSPIVLVTIDGARWQEIFDGGDPARLPAHAPRTTAAELMPNLHAMDAALGAPGRGEIRATGPNFVSLPGYSELLGGRAPRACQDNDCPRTEAETLLDDASEAGMRVAAFASWERLDRALTARPGSFLVSAGRSGDGSISPWPGSGDYRPDTLTAELALDHLAAARPDVLFLGLGDTDEHAHHGDYGGYLRALRQADAILGRLSATLEAMGPRGASTHVFVTADHGRALDFKDHGGFAPESGRVWLFAKGPRLQARGLLGSPAVRHLADIAPTLRVLLGLRTGRADVARGSLLTELGVGG